MSNFIAPKVFDDQSDRFQWDEIEKQENCLYGPGPLDSQEGSRMLMESVSTS